MSPAVPIKVGFIGLSAAGWASIALGPSLLNPKFSARYKLTAVSTTSAASASASAQEQSEKLGHEVKAYHGESSQIASDPDVDFVIVSVKAPSHKSTVLPVIAAKKDFFLEWPAGNGLAQSSEIAEAARKQGVRSIVGLQGRQSAAVKKAKELIESGAIGKIRSSSIVALSPRELGNWSSQVKERAAYTSDKTQGATLIDIAIGHQLDTFTYILGDFASVSANAAVLRPVAALLDSDGKPTGKTIDVTAADHVAFSGRLKSGAFTSITWRAGYASTKGRRQLLWEIDGEEGSIRFDEEAQSAAFMNVREPKLYLNGELVEVESVGGLPGLLGIAWAEFAKGEVGQYATIEDAVRNHRLLDAIKRSIDSEGKTVVL